jgi:hypothetical protein
MLGLGWLLVRSQFGPETVQVSMDGCPLVHSLETPLVDHLRVGRSQQLRDNSVPLGGFLNPCWDSPGTFNTTGKWCLI